MNGGSEAHRTVGNLGNYNCTDIDIIIDIKFVSHQLGGKLFSVFNA